MVTKREPSWQERLVCGEKQAHFAKRVAQTLEQQVEQAAQRRKAEETTAVKKELNRYRQTLERFNRTGLAPARHVTLWGLHQELCLNGSSALLRGTGREPALGELLERVFGGTDLDIQALWRKRKLTAGTVKNKLLIIQHGYYQYQETGKNEVCRPDLDQLSDRYCAHPVAVLQQVRDRLDASCKQYSVVLEDGAALQTDAMFQGVRAEMGKPHIPSTLRGRELALRQLSLLFVLALLTENYDPEPGTPAARWLAGEDVEGSIPPQPVPAYREPIHPGGIFWQELSEMSEELVPDVVVRGQRFQNHSGAKKDICRTPMEQVLEQWNGRGLFLLCGGGASAVSGAGKTTSLRLLCRHMAEKRPVFVPLSQVYTAYELRNLRKENGRPRLLTWLGVHGVPVGDLSELEGRPLVLDGLDEVTSPEGVQSLCDDLVALCQSGKIPVVVSSKLPPEELAAWTQGLSSISHLWRGGVRCQVQPIGRDQRQSYLTRYGRTLPAGHEALNTPFLLRLYGSNRDFFTGEQDPASCNIRARWLSGTGGSGPEALFYRYLGVQICRWCESNRGDDLRNEQDAFFLLFALPAVAFRMLIHEVCDGYYTPSAARPVDSETVEALLGGTFPALRSALFQFPVYREGGLETLTARYEDLDARGFSAGQAAAILHRSFDPSTLRWEYHFVNHAVRDELAMLHMANLFYAAYHRCPLDPEVAEGLYWDCPAHYLHRPMFRRVFAYLGELFGSEAAVRSILERGAAETPCAGPSGYLLCILAYEICAAMEIPQQRDWLARASALRSGLRPDEAGRAGVEYIMLDLCESARELRMQGKFRQAAEKARSAIRVHRDHPEFHNSDGYHSLAKVYLEQVTHSLNGAPVGEDGLTAIPQEERELADGVWRELHRLSERTRAGEAWPERLPELGRLLPQSRAILPALLALADRARLRLERYRAEDYFGDQALAFLVESSYVAKLLSICAALHEGASGAALNMLGCFCENQQELLENGPELPFFQANPQLHCDIPPEELEDPEWPVHAWQLYLRIYQIPRGLQPYTAQCLANLLLTRQVRLDETGGGVPGPGVTPALSTAELDFLWEATNRSCTGQGNGSEIQRIRLLNELLELPADAPYLQTRMLHREDLEREAADRYQKEWTRCRCEERLNCYQVDLYTVMLMAECRGGWGVALDALVWKSGIHTFFRKHIPTRVRLEHQVREAVQRSRCRDADIPALRAEWRAKLWRQTYTTGHLLGLSTLWACWERLHRLEAMTRGLYDLFHDRMGAEWSEILRVLRDRDAV